MYTEKGKEMKKEIVELSKEIKKEIVELSKEIKLKSLFIIYEEQVIKVLKLKKEYTKNYNNEYTYNLEIDLCLELQLLEKERSDLIELEKELKYFIDGMNNFEKELKDK